MADDFYYPDSKSSRNQIEEEPEKMHFQWISPGPILIFALITLLVVGGFVYYFSYVKPLNDQGAKCLGVNDCDDGNACTIDKCSSFSGICYHSNKKCAGGEFCNQNTGGCELVISSSEEGQNPITSGINNSPNQSPINPVNNSPSTSGSTSGTGTIPPPPPLPN